MPVKENNVLCISGFDPTGGAGILADIKTCEATGAYGMGVITANTVQTEDQFIFNEWVNQNTINSQLNNLLDNYTFKTVKIGIIENLSLLEAIIRNLCNKVSQINIVWDPVLKATAGYIFHPQINTSILYSILSKITLITPNIPEYKFLFGNNPPASLSKKHCAILLKGGHGNNQQIIDKLYTSDGETFFSGNKSLYKKHGTGCILSSAIASFLTQGCSLKKACNEAKNYINSYMNSDNSLLGQHNYNYGHN